MAKFTTQKKKMNILLKIEQSINAWSLNYFESRIDVNSVPSR